jgi:multisubunit Na+/H+ antiporter MnhE subunit
MYGSLPVEVDGTLTIDGAVTQEVDYSLWSFGWNIIPSTVSLRIKPERDLVFVSPLEIDGTLAIDGRLVEVD